MCAAIPACAAITAIPSVSGGFRCCTKTGGWQSAKARAGYTSVVMPRQSHDKYPTTATGVEFSTADSALLGLWNHAETCEAANRFSFIKDTFPVLIEGSEYRSAWLETQPMGGAMYATRDMRVAVDNQLVFARTQRSDGLMPGRVDAYPGRADCPWGADGLCPAYYYNFLQGLYFATPAVDVSWFLDLGKPTGTVSKPYLLEIRTALERYDAYLWSNRNSSGCCVLWSERQGHLASTCCLANASACCPHSGHAKGRTTTSDLLWSVGTGDSGEDASDKYVNNTAPFVTMDMQGYSFDCRQALARIATLLGETAAATKWSTAAAELAAKTTAALWVDEQHAMFDLDVRGRRVTTLSHNNLRMMWHGLFTQAMADAFVSHHLMNESEFFTRMPLPSISVADYRYTTARPWWPSYFLLPTSQFPVPSSQFPVPTSHFLLPTSYFLQVPGRKGQRLVRPARRADTAAGDTGARELWACRRKCSDWQEADCGAPQRMWLWLWLRRHCWQPVPLSSANRRAQWSPGADWRLLRPHDPGIH